MQERDSPSRNRPNSIVISGVSVPKPARDRRRHGLLSVPAAGADRAKSPRICGTNRYKAARDISTALSTDSRTFSCNSAYLGSEAGA